jgi:hypothetical protein
MTRSSEAPAARRGQIPALRLVPPPLTREILAKRLRDIGETAFLSIIDGRPDTSRSGAAARILLIAEQLCELMEAQIPNQCINSPKIQERLGIIDARLTEYEKIPAIPLNERKRQAFERERLLPNLDFFASNLNLFPPAQEDPVQAAKTALKQKMQSIATIEENRVDEAVNALDYLEITLPELHKRFSDRIKTACKDNLAFELRGIIGELQAIERLSKKTNIEILDAGRTVHSRETVTNKIEFFDIIARDKRTGRLILIEIKHDTTYTLMDFLHQFFGIGSKIDGQTRKTVCQLDVLLHPENFTLPDAYAEDVRKGNCEVRVITHERRPGLDLFYGDGPKKLSPLCATLTQPTFNIPASIRLSEGLSKEIIADQIRERLSEIRQKESSRAITISFGLWRSI